jgi:hypothetical protein
MSNKPIIAVSYGLASSYGDGIEINRKLDGELRERILQHELRHEEGSTYTKTDFKNDFNAENSYFKESFLWALRNPEALIGFFPFMWSYYYKKMTFNWSATVPMFYFGLIFTFFWWVLFGVNPLQSLICYVMVILGMNLILMGLTHYLIHKMGMTY